MTIEQFKEAISKAIDLYRQKNALTLRKLAKISGVPHSTLAGYENGNSIPKLAHYLKLCKIGVDFSAIQ